MTSRCGVPVIVLALALPTIVAFTPPQVAAAAWARRGERQWRGESGCRDEDRDE